jgi:hypothetical protein
LYLLDECLWAGFAAALPGRRCRTVAEEGWLGISDAELLTRARGRFEALLTSDRRFGRGVELGSHDPAIVIPRPRLDRPDHLLALAAKVEAVLSEIAGGTIREVRWWD